MNDQRLTPEMEAVIKKATRKFAYFLKQHENFKDKEIRDLQHTLTCVVLPTVKNFDIHKANFKNFIGSILRRRMLNMIRDSLRNKRDGKILPLVTEQDNEAQAQVILPDNLRSHIDDKNLEIRKDVDTVINVLPHEIWYLCQLLKYFTAADIAYIQNIDPSTVYVHIKKLREPLESLKHYLEAELCH